MEKFLPAIFVFLTLNCYSQENSREYFSEVISVSIKDYNKKTSQAYLENDFKRADFLFDSLVRHVINGSYLDNFELRKLSGRKITLGKFKKPVFLMTYASWCTPGKGEIPALNAVAKQYRKEIDFVVLFWDQKEEVKKASKAYSRHIKIIYVDELENNNSHIVSMLKHTLGFPTSFFLNKDKKILDIRRGVLHPYNKEFSLSYELNYDSFKNGISLLLNSASETNEKLVIKE